MTNRIEISRRTDAAPSAFKSALGTEYFTSIGTADTAYGATLFVEFHLEELPTEYWQKHLGTCELEPEAVLTPLIFQGYWGTEDGEHDSNGIENFDFSLPGGVTDNVICVSFKQDGEIERIEMES